MGTMADRDTSGTTRRPASADLLDSGPEESFDRYTRLASRLLRAPVSLVSLLDDDRQFFKSQFGLSGPWARKRQTPLSHSFCRHVAANQQPLVVEDARKHPTVSDNPAIEALGVIAYLGVPLVTHRGEALGAFCAIGHEPRRWTDDEVELMKDLGAAVMAEIETRMLAAKSLSDLRALQDLEAQRDDMVHALVHDLRTPLSSLLAALDMLEMLPGLTHRHHDCIERARRGGRGLLELINEILTVSRAEAGKLELALEQTRVDDLVAAAIDDMRQLAAASGITVTVETNADLPAVPCDPARLRRVLVNLLANALTHTPPGGGVRIAASEAPVGPERERGGILLTVTDTGPGIPAQDRERIFDKYEQGSAAVTRRGATGGLGLSFCKTVVEAHGGHIWVEDHPDGGACLCFTLPRSS